MDMDIWQFSIIWLSGGACFPPRWRELLVGRLHPPRDVSTVRVDHFRYPTRAGASLSERPNIPVTPTTNIRLNEHLQSLSLPFFPSTHLQL